MTDADKAWIMVEDELLATAGIFTRSLHIAEYKRLKSLAARKNENTLNSIKRPVDTRTQMSIQTRVQKAQELQAAKQAKGFKSIQQPGSKRRERHDAESSDEDSDTPIGDRNLAGLMQGTDAQKMRGTKKLDDLIGTYQANTRAAAGHQSQNSPHARRHVNHIAQPKSERPTSPSPAQCDRHNRFPSVRSKLNEEAKASKASKAETSDDDSSPVPVADTQDQLSNSTGNFLEPEDDFPKPRARRRPLKLKREKPEDEEEEDGSIKLEEIPTFLL